MYLDYTKETLLRYTGGLSAAKFRKSWSWAYCASEEVFLLHLLLPENVPFPGRLDSGRSREYGSLILPFDVMDPNAVKIINFVDVFMLY